MFADMKSQGLSMSHNWAQHHHTSVYVFDIRCMLALTFVEMVLVSLSVLLLLIQPLLLCYSYSMCDCWCRLTMYVQLLQSGYHTRLGCGTNADSGSQRTADDWYRNAGQVRYRHRYSFSIVIWHCPYHAYFPPHAASYGGERNIILECWLHTSLVTSRLGNKACSLEV